ncbi:MAG: Hydrogenase/urease nickel incorporation protein HypA [Lentisphaerae bacterium ADurb.BinA184]|nr:MAG: Hydrogenase/urease nickel incorporation protein HypA [Lentisphaerae bacterium ADurb.BinA184]
MHELSLAEELIRQVERVLAEQNASRALRLTVSIGELSGVERDAFEFAFPMAAADTPLAGATLDIEEVPARVRCRRCGADAKAAFPLLLCEACGSTEVEVAGGREFTLRSVEVV